MTGRCVWFILVAILELVVAVPRVSAQPSANITGKWVGEWINLYSVSRRGRLELDIRQASDGRLSGVLIAYDGFTDPNGFASSAGVSGFLQPNREATFQASFGTSELTAFFNGNFGSNGEASGTYTNFNLFNDQGTWYLRLRRALSSTSCLPRLDLPTGPAAACETVHGSALNLRQNLVTKDFPSGPEMSVGGTAGAQADFLKLAAVAAISLKDARPFVDYPATTPPNTFLASYSFISRGEATSRNTLRIASASAQGAGKLELTYRITGRSGFQVNEFVSPPHLNLRVAAALATQMVVNDQRRFLFCCNPPPVGAVDVSLKYVVPFVFTDPLVLDVRLLVQADPYIGFFAIPGGFRGYVEAIRLSATQGIDLMNTAVLENLLVTDAAGTPIPGVTVTSESGTTYPLDPRNAFRYNFSGFFDPVQNPPLINSVQAGRSVPIKFSLSGDQGLAVLEPGYPKSATIPCDSNPSVDGGDETDTAGSSALSYDASQDQYVYVWKTDKRWAGTCRQFVLRLIDGTAHRANFMFR